MWPVLTLGNRLLSATKHTMERTDGSRACCHMGYDQGGHVNSSTVGNTCRVVRSESQDAQSGRNAQWWTEAQGSVGMYDCWRKLDLPHGRGYNRHGRVQSTRPGCKTSYSPAIGPSVTPSHLEYRPGRALKAIHYPNDAVPRRMRSPGRPGCRYLPWPC